MPSIELSKEQRNEFGYFRTIEATNLINDPHRDLFGDDDFPFRAALMNVVNVYCGLVEQAGRGCMEIIRKLPQVDGKPVADAAVALELLRETDEALQQLAEDDAAFDESLRGALKNDPERDRYVSEEAAAFDKDFNVDAGKEAQYMASAREGQISDAQISDLATKWKNANREDNEVAASRRGDDDRAKETVRIAPIQAQPLKGNSPTTSIDNNWDTPEPFEVTEPDFVGTSPNLCFRKSTRWLIDTLIRAGTGSEKQGSYPRLSPLLRSTINGKNILASDEVIKLIAGIRRKADDLRRPNIDESSIADIMDSIGDKLNDVDPDLRSKLGNMFSQFGGMFGKSNEGEEWKNGSNDNDE